MQKKILIVDDDVAILEVVKAILTENGYAITTVQNGGMVVKKVREIKPDLILLDIWMSGHDGRDIARKLKSDKSTAKIPIIVVSAHNDAQLIAKQLHVDGFLPKPFDIDTLLTTVQTHS